MDDFERRLASRLAAYEESVPAPTRPSETAATARTARSRPSRWMLLIPAAAVVVVGVAFGLAGSGLLSGLRPVGNAPATSLEWTTRPFVPGAHVVALTAIGDRVIATGSLNDEAAAWYSDDGGETWRPSTVDSTAARTGAALAGMPHEIGALAPIGDRLVGLDAYWFSSAQTRPGGGATHTGVWISDDRGGSWSWSAGIDGQAEQIAQSPTGLIAIGTADLTRNGEGRLAAAWSSVDGKSWKGLSLAGIDTGSAWTSVAFDGSRLMAVGSAPAPASSSGVPLSGVTPAAWLSTDGSTWTYIPLDPSLVGEAAAVVTSSNGFNVAGGAYSRGDPGEEQPRLWRTADGSALFIQPLEDDPSAVAEVARTIAINDLGALVAVRANVPASSTQDRLWFVPSNEPDHAREQGLGRQVAAIAALPDRFVLLSQCSADEHCDSPTVSIGIPGYERPQRSPSPAEIPVAGVRESVTRRNLAEARNGIAGGLLEPGWLPDGFAMVNADYSAEGNVISSVDLRYEGGGHYVHVWQTRASPEELGDKDPVAKGSRLAGTQWNANPLPVEQIGHDGVVEYSTRLQDGRTATVDSDLDADTIRHVLDSMYLHPASATPTATPPLHPTPQPTESANPSAPIWSVSTIASGDGVAVRQVIETPDGLMAVGAADWGGAIWRSRDGREWERIADIPPVAAEKAVQLTNVAYSSIGYVATGVWGPRSSEVGGMVVWTSTDGIHWHDATDWSRSSSVLQIIATSRGFLAVGGQLGLTYGNGAAAWVSRDGASWTEASVGNSENATMLDVVADPDGFVSVGLQRDNTDLRPAAWRSSDGLKWEQVGVPAGTRDGAMSAIAAANGKLVAIGGSATDAEAGALIWRSTDNGITWQLVYQGSCCQMLTGVVATTRGFVATGTATDGSGTVALTSSDGSNWAVEGVIAPTSVRGLVATERLGLLAWSGSEGETNSVYSILFAPPPTSPMSRDQAVAAARHAAGASNDVKSARLGPYQDLHLTPLTSQPAAPLSQLVWRIDFDYRYPDGSFQVVIVEAYSGQLIETTGVVN